VIDILAKLIPDFRASKEANRQLEAIGERAAASLQFIFDTEGRAMFIDDQEAVAKLVADTLDRTKITAELLVRRDLDPVRLADHFLMQAQDQLATLTQPRADLFRRVIQVACQSIIDIAHQLPNFNERIFAELLQGNRVLLEAVGRVFDQINRIRAAQVDPQSESAQFETDYRLAVSRNLNRMELFGVDLAQSSKSHPLSVAYVSLEASRTANAATKAKVDVAGRASEEDEEEVVTRNVEAALAESRRILIKGPAGAGKTTLVRWVAVQAASRTFESPLEELNSALPFVIRLRHFSDTSFPRPESFPGLVAPAIGGAMPPGWAHEKLKSGMAVVMIDGVDEVADERRDEVREWIKDLTNCFPEARIVVTSRPHAAEEGWLASSSFSEAELQPMETASVERFIQHWHEAVAEEVQTEDEVARLTTLATNLKHRLRNHRAIQRLATSPLLCGVICAPHRDTNEQLPSDRLELYERCCAMLLERRDLESGLKLAHYPRLTYRQKRAILDDLATG